MFNKLIFLNLDNDSGHPENQISEEITEESLVYIAGYVSYRFRSKYPELGIPTRELPYSDPSTWICQVSRGSLIYPCENLIENARILEKKFAAFHGDNLSATNLIFQKVAMAVKSEISDCSQIPHEALMCLVRTRTYIRLRFLNNNLKKLYPKLRIAERSAKTMKYYG